MNVKNMFMICIWSQSVVKIRSVSHNNKKASRRRRGKNIKGKKEAKKRKELNVHISKSISIIKMRKKRERNVIYQKIRK